jgi:hypothetical protein
MFLSMVFPEMMFVCERACKKDYLNGPNRVILRRLGAFALMTDRGLIFAFSYSLVLSVQDMSSNYSRTSAILRVAAPDATFCDNFAQFLTGRLWVIKYYDTDGLCHVNEKRKRFTLASC